MLNNFFKFTTARKLGFLGPEIYSGSDISTLKLWKTQEDFLLGMFWKPHPGQKPVNHQDRMARQLTEAPSRDDLLVPK